MKPLEVPEFLAVGPDVAGSVGENTHDGISRGPCWAGDRFQVSAFFY